MSMMIVKALNIFTVSTVFLSSVLCQEVPVGYNVRLVAGTAGLTEVCPATQNRDSILQEVRSLINDRVLPTLNTGSGYGPCGCGGSGWRRVAYLNMSDPTQTCPTAWELITSPRRSCGRPSSTRGGCDSVMFPTQGIQYSQVCGRVIGYQDGQTQAFLGDNEGNPQTIDGDYVAGVSLTYGNPRQHIWTFAAALDERTGSAFYQSQCECTDASDLRNLIVPSYVGNDYFCDTGVPTGRAFDSFTFYADDPLWDGQGCGPTNACCTFNNPPWFCKQLPQSTDADLEIRLCTMDATLTENTPVELVEIYAK